MQILFLMFFHDPRTSTNRTQNEMSKCAFLVPLLRKRSDSILIHQMAKMRRLRFWKLLGDGRLECGIRSTVRWWQTSDALKVCQVLGIHESHHRVKLISSVTLASANEASNWMNQISVRSFENGGILVQVVCLCVTTRSHYCERR